MIVLPAYTLRSLMAQIVEATHGLENTAGRAHVMSTIPEAQLRMAAICAVQIATGETVHPGDRKITIEKRQDIDPIFEYRS
jgi:hypothetical protein